MRNYFTLLRDSFSDKLRVHTLNFARRKIVHHTWLFISKVLRQFWNTSLLVTTCFSSAWLAIFNRGLVLFRLLEYISTFTNISQKQEEKRRKSITTSIAKADHITNHVSDQAGRIALQTAATKNGFAFVHQASQPRMARAFTKQCYLCNIEFLTIYVCFLFQLKVSKWYAFCLNHCPSCLHYSRLLQSRL